MLYSLGSALLAAEGAEHHTELPMPALAYGLIVMGILLLLIAVAAVSGILFAMSSGQPQVALIVGLVSAAFFSRIRC